MRAISVSQDRKAKFAIAIAKQESRVTLNTAAMCKVTIAVTNLRPPGQPKPAVSFPQMFSILPLN
jgi:hypothetical protein